MKFPHRTLEIVFALAFYFIARNAGAQSLNGVFAGTTGTPLTFTLEADCIHGDPHDTLYWDFGPGATPQKATVAGIYDGSIAVNFAPQEVTYSTPGHKTFTLTTASAGNSPITTTYALQIYDCSIPSIPHDAIVINAGTTIADRSKTYWVNPGATLIVYGNEVDYDTIFAESGSTISGSGPNQSVLYMKHGSVLSSTFEENSVIFGDGATTNTSSTDFTLNCPTLDFDYTNAPPNPAHSSGVEPDLKPVALTLSPNPTAGILHVEGLPPSNATVSVFNILGESVLVQKNRSAHDITLDLSKLVSGTYYVRISSANSVVTKKVVREWSLAESSIMLTSFYSQWRLDYQNR